MTSKEAHDFSMLPTVENPGQLFEILGIYKSNPPEALGAEKQPQHEEPAQPSPLGLSCVPLWANALKKDLDTDQARANFKIKEVVDELIELDCMKIKTLRCKHPMRWAITGDSDDELDYDDYRDKPKPLHSAMGEE